jgi:hypothetical protein
VRVATLAHPDRSRCRVHDSSRLHWGAVGTEMTRHGTMMAGAEVCSSPLTYRLAIHVSDSWTTTAGICGSVRPGRQPDRHRQLGRQRAQMVADYGLATREMARLTRVESVRVPRYCRYGYLGRSGRGYRLDTPDAGHEEFRGTYEREWPC